MLKKADIFLIVGLLLVGLGLWSFFSFSRSSGSSVTVSVNGEVLKSYSLDETVTIPLEQGEWQNTVRIQDGTVKMESSNCPGKECVHQGKISKSGETIICLPHRIVLEITADEASFDVIVS